VDYNCCILKKGSKIIISNKLFLASLVQNLGVTLYGIVIKI